jgi:hypothetical protein
MHLHLYVAQAQTHTQRETVDQIVSDDLHPAPLNVFVKRLCAVECCPHFQNVDWAKCAVLVLVLVPPIALCPEPPALLPTQSGYMCQQPIPPLVWDTKLTDC